MIPSYSPHHRLITKNSSPFSSSLFKYRITENVSQFAPFFLLFNSRGRRVLMATLFPQSPPSTHFNYLSLLFISILVSAAHASSGVFKVQKKFAGNNHSLSDLIKHDVSRHSRLLSSISVPLLGNAHPNDAGLYYTEIEIGTPPKKFRVQVDTGSDILWVNCASCDGCPDSSRVIDHLGTYHQKDSKTSSLLACDSAFCGVVQGGNSACPGDHNCNFEVEYADQSTSSGYFVTDILNYNQVSADHETKPGSANITFGCATKLTGMADSGMEGLIGFGQAGSSVISQLASSNKAPKIFSHCLDSVNGGGIFAIGTPMLPKMESTPLIPNMPHYNVNLKSVEVGLKTLDIPNDVFETSGTKGTIIDSGSTLGYVPNAVYTPLFTEVFTNMHTLVMPTEDDFACFTTDDSVDDIFPVITLHFGAEDNSSANTTAAMRVKPSEYFFENGEMWCFGWRNKGGEDGIILGDMVLANKLVVYNLDNNTLSWTDYDCTSSLKLQDDESAADYTYDPPKSSSVRRMEMGSMSLLLPLTFLLCFYNLLSF